MIQPTPERLELVKYVTAVMNGSKPIAINRGLLYPWGTDIGQNNRLGMPLKKVEDYTGGRGYY